MGWYNEFTGKIYGGLEYECFRSIRQGEIKADIKSKKEGYVIDSDSLNTFIQFKGSQDIQSEQPSSIDINFQVEEAYRKWREDGRRTTDYGMKEAVSERENELILKGLKEDFIRFSSE